jgi:chromate transporter
MSVRLFELAKLFLKLGTIGFGGPAAHYAFMEEEAVNRRGWLTRQHFLDLIGATNLIPGPNSTEIAMHIGHHRAGMLGLVVAGLSFLLPAVVVTTIFAWAYVTFGEVDAVAPFLFGVKPAVVAIIFTAGWRLGRKAIANWRLAVLCLTAAFGSLTGFGQIRSLLATSVVGLMWLVWASQGPGQREANGDESPDEPPAKPNDRSDGKAGKVGMLGGAIAAAAAGGAKPVHAATLPALLATTTGTAATLSLWKLGLFFLQVGAVLYGTGYVLVAYLEGGLVDQMGWLTRDQLYEAIAIGNFTPGPILSTATFIGYVLFGQSGDVASGIAGAVVASIAIFLPSFFFVAALGPIIPKLRKNRWAAAFLDAVNAASIGLIVAVTLKLCADLFLLRIGEQQSLAVNWPSLLIAVVAVAILIRFKPTPAWMVLFGAVAGWLISFAVPVV